jgi:DNA-binding PadR family transcriptional regulator
VNELCLDSLGIPGRDYTRGAMKVDQTAGQLDMLLLAALAQGPAHGYGVIARLRDDSGGAFAMPEGTIYPALHRLEAAGFITSSEELIGRKRRRTYALTDAGVERLDARRAEWTAFSTLVSRMIGVQPA